MNARQQSPKTELSEFHERSSPIRKMSECSKVSKKLLGVISEWCAISDV